MQPSHAKFGVGRLGVLFEVMLYLLDGKFHSLDMAELAKGSGIPEEDFLQFLTSADCNNGLLIQYRREEGCEEEYSLGECLNVEIEMTADEQKCFPGIKAGQIYDLNDGSVRDKLYKAYESGIKTMNRLASGGEVISLEWLEEQEQHPGEGGPPDGETGIYAGMKPEDLLGEEDDIPVTSGKPKKQGRRRDKTDAKIAIIAAEIEKNGPMSAPELWATVGKRISKTNTAFGVALSNWKKAGYLVIDKSTRPPKYSLPAGEQAIGATEAESDESTTTEKKRPLGPLFEERFEKISARIKETGNPVTLSEIYELIGESHQICKDTVYSLKLAGWLVSAGEAMYTLPEVADNVLPEEVDQQIPPPPAETQSEQLIRSEETEHVEHPEQIAQEPTVELWPVAKEIQPVEHVAPPEEVLPEEHISTHTAEEISVNEPNSELPVTQVVRKTQSSDSGTPTEKAAEIRIAELLLNAEIEIERVRKEMRERIAAIRSRCREEIELVEAALANLT